MAIEVRQTQFFDSCRAVFQGGGCRASALAGAYRAARAAGMHFTAVAGTSAGSILAALIGAGAEPDWIVKKIQGLDFTKTFLAKPVPQGQTPGWGIKAAGWAAGKVFGKAELSDLASYEGFYSSRGIEDWLNECLKEILHLEDRFAEFRDLVLPTFVVATDLAKGRERVWGTGLTDTTKVAFAVRASCSIPGFFQPVMEGSTALVDGGLLSNLPAFVYAKADKEAKNRARGRILAFQLMETFEEPKDWGLKTLALQLVNTVVGGATELQTELHGGVHPLRIPTGDVKATDFQRMSEAGLVDTLIRDGEKAVQDFVATEATQLLGEGRASVARDQDEIYSAVVYQAEALPSELLIAQPGTRWYWELFPTILYLRARGVKVRVLVEAAKGDERERKHEATRRANAAALGIDIRETAAIPFSGYCFAGKDPLMQAAIVHTPDAYHGPKGMIYFGLAHEPVIEGLRTKFEAQHTGAPAGPVEYIPKLVAYKKEELLAMLREGVGQYGDAELSIETVPTREIRPITQLVRAFKYRQAIRLAQDFGKAGLPLFGSVAVELANGAPSVMGPPVIEIHGSRKIGIEGNSRTYYCYRRGIEKIECVVVRGVTEELPGHSVELGRVNVIEGFLAPAERMPGFRYDKFRRIEGALHPFVSG